MKICLSCSSANIDDSWHCKECGWKAAMNDGIVKFASHITGATESYDPAWYKELADLEAANFWFVARNRLIQWLAKRFAPIDTDYLEVGCGTGFVLQMLYQTFPKWRISATEFQPEGLKFARKRVPIEVRFFQMDACAIPFSSEFGVIGAFDVIEHIPNDRLALEQIYAALKPGGYFILSVPQHMFLWSKYDEVGCHFRRYSADELESKLLAVGFSILATTSFNSLLLPLMLLSRALKKVDSSSQLDVLAELRLLPALNVLLSYILRFELTLIRLGFSFPFGGSRVVVAQKPVC